MHTSSMNNMKAFFDKYVKTGDSILDIGSKIYHRHTSYKDLIPEGATYCGMDLEAGENVDLVVENPYEWEEIEDNTFDIIISGQTFEHNPFFWKSFEEIVRVCKPDGMICVIAPSKGNIHRYPVDCWRFHPDGMQALADYTSIRLIESFIDANSKWGDCVGIFKNTRSE